MPDISSVNGDIFSWQSCQFLAEVLKLRGITGLDFADKIENEYVDSDNQDGTPSGMTYGKYTPDDISLRVLRSRARAFEAYIASLALVPGSGIGAGRFTLTAKLYEPSITGIAGADITILGSTRIVGIKDTREVGTGALVTEYTCRCRTIKRNGLTLYDASRGLL